MTLPAPPLLAGGSPLPPDLLARAHSAAAGLRAGGIGEGGRIAVEAAAADALCWFLGADLLGAATLVLEPRWTARERAAVLDDARPGLVVGGPPPADPAIVEPVGGDTAFYLPTTSGSSGRPTVLLRHRESWRRSFAALGPVPGPVRVAGPLSSSLFLFAALHGLWCGAEPVFGDGPAATVHVVPAMLAELAPGPLRTIVCGGAHLDAALRERIVRERGVRLVEYYGSAEHSLVALRGPAGLLAVPGVDLEVREGELWVRSPLACAGRLRSGVLDAAAEWTSVGDRAELVDGVLTVHGRGSATISTGGLLVAAEEVEAVLRGVPGVADVVVAGLPHPRLGAVVAAVVEGGPPLRALRAAAREGLEPRKRPRVWLAARSLPRTASGKPARGLLTEQLAAGTLDAAPLR